VVRATPSWLNADLTASRWNEAAALLPPLHSMHELAHYRQHGHRRALFRNSRISTSCGADSLRPSVVWLSQRSRVTMLGITAAISHKIRIAGGTCKLSGATPG